MSGIRELTDREKAICRVALLAMAADETPFDIGEGFDFADAKEVEAVAELIMGATGLV